MPEVADSISRSIHLPGGKNRPGVCAPMAASRKRTLEKLESPEQLDHLLRFTSIKSWLALFAMCVALSAALVWGIYGKVETTVSGTTVFRAEGGTFTIVAPASGHIIKYVVNDNDLISPGQVIAFMSDHETERSIVAKKQELEELEEREKSRTEMIVAKNKSQRTFFETDRKELTRKEQFLRQRVESLKERVKVYEELVKLGASPRKALLDAELEYQKGIEEIADTQLKGVELTSKMLALDAEQDEQLFELRAKIDSAKREVGVLEKKLQYHTSVRAELPGRVLQLESRAGHIISRGEPLIICEKPGTQLGASIYVPAAQGKLLSPGMKIQVTPSTVKREEYGYISGKVERVGRFVLTEKALVAWLHSEKLIQYLHEKAKGPLIFVEGDMDRDPATKSGFNWSSSKGVDVMVTPGTLGDAVIIVKEQAPVTLVLPMLKKWFGE
jgi:HlyD family secretion protein